MNTLDENIITWIFLLPLNGKTTAADRRKLARMGFCNNFGGMVRHCPNESFARSFIVSLQNLSKTYTALFISDKQFKEMVTI